LEDCHLISAASDRPLAAIDPFKDLAGKVQDFFAETIAGGDLAFPYAAIWSAVVWRTNSDQQGVVAKNSAALVRGNIATNCEGQDYAGTNPGAVIHESARRPTNRLSAPVSARSLLPKKVQLKILDFVTQKISSTPE
jgi:hypothetical protein